MDILHGLTRLSPHQLSIRSDRTRAEVAQNKLDGEIHGAIAEALRRNGWQADGFRFMIKRDQLHLEDKESTLVYALCSYSFTADGSRVGYELGVDALKTLGIRDSIAIEAAARHGQTLANAHIAAGI